jgi:hypothetical protein
MDCWQGSAEKCSGCTDSNIILLHILQYGLLAGISCIMVLLDSDYFYIITGILFIYLHLFSFYAFLCSAHSFYLFFVVWIRKKAIISLYKINYLSFKLRWCVYSALRNESLNTLQVTCIIEWLITPNRTKYSVHILPHMLFSLCNSIFFTQTAKPVFLPI